MSSSTQPVRGAIQRLTNLGSSTLPARAVIKRELLSGLRNPRPFAFLTVLMAVMIGGLYFTMTVVYDATLRAQGMSIPAHMVKELFMQLSMAVYLAGALLIPPLAGVSICVEKQQDSLDLLQMTYIRPLSLALAKLLNVLGLYLLLLVATLPFVGVFLFLVGIDTRQFFLSLSLILCSALSLATIGLACSAWFYRTLPAIITTFLVGIAVHGGGLLLLLFVEEYVLRHTGFRPRFIARMDEEIVAALFPFVGLGLSAQGTVSAQAIVNTLLYHGAIALVGLCVALSILGRPARPPRVDQEKPIDDQAELKARRKRFPFYLLDPRRRRPVIRDSQNAMFAKERQTGLLGRGTFAVRVLYGFTLVSFFIAVMTVSTSALGRQSHTAIALSLFLDTLLILVFTPTLVATAMAREWEWQNVDSLRMTLLTPREILWGKLHASIRLVSLPIIGALLGSSVLLFFAYDSPLFWTVTFISSSFLFICVVYTLALSLWCTVGMRRSLTALLVAYGTGIFALGLLPIAGLMALNILVPDIRLHDEHFVTMFLLSPIYAFQAVLENYGRRYAPYTMDNYWAGACCFYLLFSGLLFWHAERRFRRALEREHL